MKPFTQIKPFLYAALLGSLLAGCVSTQPEIRVSTKQHSPIRVYIHQKKPDPVQQTLLLPPLGIADATTRKQIQQQLHSAARRHFENPLQLVSTDSAYANYITERNLMNSDGTLNTSEVVMIGQLMNSSHVLCPTFQEIRPYHPQKIALEITVVETKTGKVVGELAAVLDAKDRDVRDWFSVYCKQHRAENETAADLLLKLRSPGAFQGFVSDACFTLLSERLPF